MKERFIVKRTNTEEDRIYYFKEIGNGKPVGTVETQDIREARVMDKEETDSIFERQQERHSQCYYCLIQIERVQYEGDIPTSTY